MNRALLSSASDEWSTPEETYHALDAEFQFADDPCPLGGSENGLFREWQSPCFVNPPYSKISDWMEKTVLEHRAGKTIVMLVPSRTDTRWWHNFAMLADEIRFIRGRLRFGGHDNAAPFPSVILVYRAKQSPPPNRACNS